jgi:hypothetical protein
LAGVPNFGILAARRMQLKWECVLLENTGAIDIDEMQRGMRAKTEPQVKLPWRRQLSLHVLILECRQSVHQRLPLSDVESEAA